MNTIADIAAAIKAQRIDARFLLEGDRISDIVDIHGERYHGGHYVFFNEADGETESLKPRVRLSLVDGHGRVHTVQMLATATVQHWGRDLAGYDALIVRCGGRFKDA